MLFSTIIPLLRRHRGKAAATAALSVAAALYVRKRTANARRRADAEAKKGKHKRRYSRTLMEALNKRKHKGEVNAEFFRRLQALFGLLVPSWQCKETLLLGLQALFLFGRTIASIYVARLDGFIVKSLVSGNLPNFLRGLVYWCLVSIPATYINSMIKYLQSKISIAFRTRLVDHVHDVYLSNMTYYAVGNLDSRVENADQLITQDTTKFCESLSALYSNLAKPILDVALFGTQLAYSVGSGGPLMMVGFYLVTGVILRAVTPPFGKLTAEEARLEGEFRHAQSRLIVNAEEIAFYGGAEKEKSILHRAYRNLIRHVNYIYSKRILHGMIESIIIKYLASAQGLLICAIPVFWSESLGRFGGKAGSGSDDLSRTEDYIANRRYLLNLADAIGRILFSYREVNELAGRLDRVHMMITVFEEVHDGKYNKTISDANQAQLQTLKDGRVITDSETVEFENVPIVTPNGDVLVRAANFKIEPGMHLIITGPNGCGKSSLFRQLGGLWPTLAGVMRKPGKNNLFYIPQRPYLCMGTLRDQIIYPDSLADMEAKGHTDQYIMDLLELCHLANVPGEQGGLDAVKEWKDVLSGGQKQRVGLARLFYHKPGYAILDECTSQISLDVEGKLYTHAAEEGITLLTVSHRPSLWQYHDYVLQFDGNGNITFNRMDAGHRQDLEGQRATVVKKLKDVPTLQTRYQELCGLLGDSVDESLLRFVAE